MGLGFTKTLLTPPTPPTPPTQVGAAEGVTAQLEEVASQLSAYKAKLAAAQEEVRVCSSDGLLVWSLAQHHEHACQEPTIAMVCKSACGPTAASPHCYPHSHAA